MRKLRDTTFAHFAGDAVLGSISPFEIWNGGDGNDVHVGTDSDDTLNGNGGNDTLSGGAGADLIDGGTGNDILAGDVGDDVVHGGIGDDTITSTEGADAIDGGDGYDTWIGSYASATGAFTFDQRTGMLSNGTTLTGIESIQLTTGSGADQFTMNGEQAFTIDAGGGTDTFAFDPTGGSRSGAALTVSIQVGAGPFYVTLQDGSVTSNAYRFEQLAITGSTADDLFAVGRGTLPVGPAALSLDGGAGTDKLVWDLSDYAVTNFIVDRDGTVETTLGAIRNFETFDLTLGTNVGTVILGDGNDTVKTSQYTNNDTIKMGKGDDLINLLGYNETAYGGSGADTFNIRGSRETIFGNDGNDVIVSDYYDYGNKVDGGLGYDSFTAVMSSKASYNQATDSFSNGTSLVNIEKVSLTTIQGPSSYFSLVRASDLTIVSQSRRDYFAINLENMATSVIFHASVDLNRNAHIHFGDTDITLNRNGRSYQTVTFVATKFDDTITLQDLSATAILPTIDGGAGLDTLGVHLASGGQFVVADDGTVTSTAGVYLNFERYDISVDGDGSLVSLGGGDDTITVNATATFAADLSGGGGDDIITGALGVDTIRGGEGDDVLSGGDGDDLLNGGLGDDTIDGGAGTDAAGYDGAIAGVTVSLLKAGPQDTKGAGVDTLTGIESLYGTEFKDKLTGDANANLLRGREGDDLLKGGAGEDRLEGGPGVDRLAGGKGADTFAFMKLTDISLGAPDRITDFRHTDADKIELSNIDLSKDAGDQAFTFIGTSVFTGRTDIFELRVQDIGNKTYIVQGDVNHDGVADFTFDVKTDGPLVANDFVL